RTTLVFVNTRRLAERVAHDLGERLGEAKVAAHHGSMSKDLRLSAEERLKAGTLSVMVATASLELGIDIGNVDVVVQLGTTRAINVLLQRVGRAGHHKAGISKGILVALTRDELAECVSLLNAVREKDLDVLVLPEKPLDVLAQQLAAACACEEWDERALYSLVRRAWPYRGLGWEEFEKVLRMMAEGVSDRRGRSHALLHRDRINTRLKARKGVRMVALMNGGAIPDTFTFPVQAEPDGRVVGNVDEDFAIDSMAGDVFLLGSTSWRILRVTLSSVQVEDAQGQPPSVPFWRGEAPGRTDALSRQVGRTREELLGRNDARDFLEHELHAPAHAAEELQRYLETGEKALGAIPSQTCVVAERFFDESGGMQLILHAPFGSRINRAWGLALRKKFCRSFDFELQAAATEDGILLSLSDQHSFPLEDIFGFLHPDRVEEVLVQAVLQVPIFGTRFRWVSSRALAMQRFQAGKRVPPHLQRARSEDLLAAVFPAGVGCQDNHGGADVELPDHPLVTQAMDDCLREHMDVDGLKAVLRGLRDGTIRTLARDLPEPSVFAHQMLQSQPYTFLDGAPLEERRARAVALRRTLSPQDAVAFGALDAAAIEQVVEEAKPLVRDEDELHDALLTFVALPEAEVPAGMLETLVAQRRAAWMTLPAGRFAVAAERVWHVRALWPGVVLEPAVEPPPGDAPVESETAAVALVRGRMEVCGPITAAELAVRVGLGESQVLQALARLESDGQVLRGAFRPSTGEPLQEWCDRRLLQRIHRLTVGKLRREIEPLSTQDFMRFLFRWHHLEEDDTLRGEG
ncbi:MAG: DEAD/DEAH box helicase, partial [Myxococcaceae bacterium]|nr:DEAD/DEAH box helicase [Myxococcaceae bacterium]